MPHQSTELSLAAADTGSRHHDGQERSARVAGPGWFESSWDLHRGLEVRESWSDDQRVHGWIEDFLRTQRAMSADFTACPSSITAMA